MILEIKARPKIGRELLETCSIESLKNFHAVILWQLPP